MAGPSSPWHSFFYFSGSQDGHQVVTVLLQHPVLAAQDLWVSGCLGPPPGSGTRWGTCCLPLTGRSELPQPLTGRSLGPAACDPQSSAVPTPPWPQAPEPLARVGRVLRQEGLAVHLAPLGWPAVPPSDTFSAARHYPGPIRPVPKWGPEILQPPEARASLLLTALLTWRGVSASHHHKMPELINL